MKLHLALPALLVAVLIANPTLADDPDDWADLVLPPRAAEMADAAAPESAEAPAARNDILWPGFLTGTEGFDDFVPPIGNPIFFEDPRIQSSVQIVHIWHQFPGGSTHSGGDLNAVAVQARLAVTERLAVIATKSGYMWLRSDALPDHDGWSDIALGAKYALWVDPEQQFILTAGVRWELSNGTGGVLQGDAQELSPFVSFAKGWDRLHLLGNVTGRIPVDRNEGNHIVSWDLHLDYEVCPHAFEGLYAVAEVHGLHYLRSGDRTGLDVGGIDVANLGSVNVAGSFVIWGGVGFEWKLTEHLSVGSMWEFPLHQADGDSFGQRVTSHLRLSW